VYGLNKDEIRYVWDDYKDIIYNKINSKDNINESHYGQDDKFLDKVVKQISSETKIYPDDGSDFGSIDPPFLNRHRVDPWFTGYFQKQLVKYCKNIYGLKDEKEIDYVWEEYKTFIRKGFNQPYFEYGSERLYPLRR